MNSSYFKDKLLLAGLSNQTFSYLTKIPIRTIENWLTSRKGKEGKIPNWVESYLDLYIKNRENEILIKKLYKELKKDNK